MASSSSKKLISLNSDGTVASTQNGYDPSSFIPADFSVETLIIDNTLPDLYASVTTRQTVSPIVSLDSNNTEQEISAPVITTTTRFLVNPLTEQLLRGTAYGVFSTGEPVFQSMITPTIVNNYVVGGLTSSVFVPTIGSIGVSGEIGLRSGQFKGTYNDLAAQKAAGLQLPAFTTSASTPYVLIEGWIFFEQEPSNNYDPIIMTRSADGVNNSTRDSFRLEYDTSSDQIQFHYSDSTYASAGYRGIVNVSPSGISMGQWHHFAVAWALTGGSASIKTYWDGTSLYSASGFTGYLRNSVSPVTIGSGGSGDYPLKAWLEDVHIRMGGETLALADYAALGSTAANPYEQDYAGDYTVYLLSMNGPIEQSFFPVDNVCRVVGNTTFNFSTSGVIGAGNIVRETSGVLGLTLFSGLCGGFTATGGSGGYLFGYRSGACMKIDSVEQLVQLADAKTQRRSSAEHSNYFLFGVTVMQGTSLSNGDFAELFGGGWTGQYFSFLPIQTNINWLRNLYDNVAVTGYTGNTLIEDYYGTMNSFGTTHMKNLYKDVVAYRADGLQLRNALVNQVTGTSTLQALKEVTGISTAAVLKLAPYADESTALYLPPKAKITKVTSVPESVNLPKTKYTPIFDPLPYDEG